MGNSRAVEPGLARQDWRNLAAGGVTRPDAAMERRAVLRLADSWIWDFWFADDGRSYHVFFLKAARSLGDPESRHFNVAIGHATSQDLAGWTATADVLAPAASPAFDDLGTWTGSVVRSPDGTWFMFCTGGTNTGPGVKQRIGVATSGDLYTWQRHRASPVAESDSGWYELLGPGRDEAWRDPWVSPTLAGTAGTCW